MTLSNTFCASGAQPARPSGSRAAASVLISDVNGFPNASSMSLVLRFRNRTALPRLFVRRRRLAPSSESLISRSTRQACDCARCRRRGRRRMPCRDQFMGSATAPLQTTIETASAVFRLVDPHHGIASSDSVAPRSRRRRSVGRLTFEISLRSRRSTHRGHGSHPRHTFGDTRSRDSTLAHRRTVVALILGVRPSSVADSHRSLHRPSADGLRPRSRCALPHSRADSISGRNDSP
jgi:hypothetical protein